MSELSDTLRTHSQTCTSSLPTEEENMHAQPVKTLETRQSEIIPVKHNDTKYYSVLYRKERKCLVG